MPTPRTPIVALLAALAVLPLAGCSGKLGANDVSGPTAELETSTGTPWAGEPVTFDGQSSEAPGDDSEIVLWRFDFGDGTVTEVDSEDEARLQHVYAEPGLYTATLTVESREGDDGRERDSTSVELGVGERVPVQAALVRDPVGIEAGSNQTVPVAVDEDASRYVVNLTVTGSAGVGSSRVQVRFLDPSGTELGSEDVTVDPGQSRDVELTGALARTGTYDLRLTADSGAADVGGVVEIRYDVAS